MKKICALFLIVLTLLIGIGIHQSLCYTDLSFAGHIVAIDGDLVSIELSSETDVHNGHVYIRENKTKDGFVATREDIGRPVIAFVRDPRTPEDVTDDILGGFWVF